MQLIDKGIRHNLGGETKVEFRPTGLYVELNVPLEPSKEPRRSRSRRSHVGLSGYSSTPDLLVGMAQALGELARQIAEDGDHDVGMRGRELVQLLTAKP